MQPRLYRIVPFGPTGCGKSQLCNFIYKDKENKKFEVSMGFESQTKEPQSEIFTRKIDDEVINLELVDTAGCSDSAGDDEENFKKLIIKLKEKKYVDLFILVFNFASDRIDKPTRDYIKLIANTFTPTELYNHLAIVYTHYPQNPSDNDKIRKKNKTKKIIEVIKDIIGLANGQAAIPPNIYELDTEKYNGNFIPKFQATIDIILIKMLDIINLIGPVNTENIKYCGIKDRLKEEQLKLEQQKKEFERIQKLEEEKKKIYEELMKKREEKIKEEEAENKREKERLEQRWNYLQSESARIQSIKDDMEATHKKCIDTLKNLINKNNIEIVNADNLISKNNKEIQKEENEKWRGNIYWASGKFLCFTYIFRKKGKKLVNEGNYIYNQAAEKIENLKKENKEQEEKKEKYKKLNEDNQKKLDEENLNYENSKNQKNNNLDEEF